ncbi:MAG: hypothetical protein IJ398_05100 [Clostridia bacterium]|nr:hypothetical protein [Clostridia bacterium]
MNNENDSVGFLIVSVNTANGALPVEGATVTVYGGNEAKSDVIYSLKTDESGRTEKVVLSTKSKELSTEPGNIAPFKSYNIEVSAPGYYDNNYINVPIFQGITSLQGVSLIPLSEFSAPNDYIPNSGRRYFETPNTDL